MSLIRRRKPVEKDPNIQKDENDDKKEKVSGIVKEAKAKRKWSCVDNCCWFVGCVCTTWWLLLFMYNAMPASLPQYVTEAITGPLPDPPGVKLKKEGLKVKHPVVFVPGIVTGGLELWEGHECAEGLFRKRLWGGTFGEVYKRPSCWVEHMSLDNESGLDPPGIRVRPVSGLVAADYFAPGYFVWAVLIANLARIGYEEKTMYMASYDWRISYQNTEVRDQTLSRIKSNIELMVTTNGGKKAVIIPHSMGVLYFMHFMKWVEAPTPMGGGGGPDWCAKHIKAVINIGGPFLGVPKAVAGLFSAEAKDIAFARAIAPVFLDNDIFRIQTLQHVMKMTRTWDSTMSMIPKGGDIIWGDLDCSPEDGHLPSKRKQKNNDTGNGGHNDDGDSVSSSKKIHYGRIISFGKDIAEADSSEIERIEFLDAIKGHNLANTTCRDVWTEYHDMGIEGIRAISDYKVYTAGSVIDLLHYVAPHTMERGSAHFSYGIADNLDDPKYNHYKYWSNPLETRLPNAPDMEIFSLYGVGIPTERAYVYKLSPAAECYIPFQIDTAANEGDEDGCLKDGVYTVDGDETVPVLSAGYMCAKGWRGKTRFNPSGIRTYVREFSHSPPSNLLEGRGTQSGAHVDIMGNFALIEDILRIAAGAQGEDLRGNLQFFLFFPLFDSTFRLEEVQSQRDEQEETAMDGGGAVPNRSVEDVFSDFRGRRNGVIKALTVDVEEFFHQCDPEKENLCLYGFPNEVWEVNLPAEEVPPELPEPALGINFARDGMQERDWLALVAVHSDSWLLSVAYYFGARFGFDKSDRRRLFNMINDLPTVFEVVTGIGKKQVKEKSSSANGTNRPKSSFKTREPEIQGMHARQPQPQPQPQAREEVEALYEEDEDEHGDTLCGACGENYASDEFWICCDICEKWFHGKCVRITPAKAEHIKQYKCPSCSNKRGRI